jgi:Domain of unknown function (DUF397)
MNEHKLADWRKSSYSGDGNSCVEVAAANPVIGVRDTKRNGRGPVLQFSATAWREFLTQVKQNL